MIVSNEIFKVYESIYSGDENFKKVFTTNLLILCYFLLQIINNDREKEKGQAADKNRNRFQIRRNISMGMYDVALLMANVSQLRTHLDSDSPKHYMLVLVFLLASILLHVISAVLLYILFAIEKLNENIKNQEPKGKNDNEGIQSQITTCSFCSRNQSLCYCWHMYKIDCVATFLVFVVTVLNVFITAFFDK